MNTKTILFQISILFLLNLTACISMQLPTQTKSQKSQNVVFTAPQGDFKPMSLDAADAAWISQRTGNTISFLSDCATKSESSLDALQSESLNALTEIKIIETKELNYNNRAALTTTANGKIDGVPVALKLVTFKKNNCSYNLTYAGVKEKFELDLTTFDNFLTNFRAP